MLQQGPTETLKREKQTLISILNFKLCLDIFSVHLVKEILILLFQLLFCVVSAASYYISFTLSYIMRFSKILL